ncbi:UDP-glucuronate:xylan alpha-glucuronosyltransferase 2-like [Telopea speciosissima]|uniref:UDP-glucuronate:xylan alpha-glucuronosyltransferase 2-like n=1 Tax=Telopea speciosissima TaxID=54955 RepID=UPI001CC6DDFF|nr:UDP-glucuronate:xylan alpha-glucuronosyltransferase 2-like [Telopea speciosissima]
MFPARKSKYSIIADSTLAVSPHDQHLMRHCLYLDKRHLIKGLVLMKMLKGTTTINPSKALVIRINLVFFTLFFVIYLIVLLGPSTSSYHLQYPATTFRCSSSPDCHHHQKVEDGVVKMKAAVLEEKKVREKSKMMMITRRREKPSFLNEMGSSMKIGMVNMDGEDMSEWESHGKLITVGFDRVSKYLKWKDLFPEWIDEEEESEGPSCPELPMPDFMAYDDEMDMVVAKLPCEYPEKGWSRDVFRLQVHLIAAHLAVNRGKRDGGTMMMMMRTKMVFLSPCRPMMELFRCDDMVRKEGDWWWYEPEMGKLEQKVSLPIGSCKLALPLWKQGSIDEAYNQSKMITATHSKNVMTRRRREAYATVLHSSEAYVCGAVALAQSILATGTNRDLVLLLDESISQPKRDSLAASGWKIRIIRRIRNPKAEKNSYNEYNYSKFRLWQLTDYDKIIFIDSDIVVLRNMDILFQFPQMSARGNDGSIFNSGIMAIEPSNCTFKALMELRKEIVSYNGGDQGFLNEVFVWWHRWPRRVNYLKNFWANTTLETSMKNQLFAADPPKLYSIHFLGVKPWLCYRDYDCNWNIGSQRIFASDVAHRRWWKVHDAMDERLHKFCSLTPNRKFQLDWERKMARKMGFQDGHWNINISDPRQHIFS